MYICLNIKHDHIDVDLIAKATAGSSGTELASIVNEAALHAVRIGKKCVSTTICKDCYCRCLEKGYGDIRKRKKNYRIP